MRKIVKRVVFLTDEETFEAFDAAVQELKGRRVKVPKEDNGPNRVTLGFLMRELARRHLAETVEEIAQEYGEPLKIGQNQPKP